MKIITQELIDCYLKGFNEALTIACSHIIPQCTDKEHWLNECRDMFPLVTSKTLEEIWEREESWHNE